MYTSIANDMVATNPSSRAMAHELRSGPSLPAVSPPPDHVKNRIAGTENSGGPKYAAIPNHGIAPPSPVAPPTDHQLTSPTSQLTNAAMTKSRHVRAKPLTLRATTTAQSSAPAPTIDCSAN